MEQVLVAGEVRCCDGNELAVPCRDRACRGARQQMLVSGEDGGGHQQRRSVVDLGSSLDLVGCAVIATDQTAEQNVDVIGHVGTVAASADAALTDG